MQKLIPLAMWAARRYDPAPSERTLRHFAALFDAELKVRDGKPELP